MAAVVILQDKCVGCGACSIACKKENNVDTGMFWSHHQVYLNGTFPDVQFEYIPTMCNHCTDAACVRVCPTSAMHKDENGLTLHDPNKCMMACPYDVINYNKPNVDRSWDSTKTIISDCTSSAKEMQEKTGEPVPYYNADREATYPGIREKGTVEKCTMCDHRVKNGLEPYCVTICPAEARVFGDLDDPTSKASLLLSKYESKVLKPEAGTHPAVHYVRSY